MEKKGGETMEQLNQEQLAAVKRIFRVNQLHFQFVRGNFLLANGKGILSPLLVAFDHGEVFLRRRP